MATTRYSLYFTKLRIVTYTLIISVFLPVIILTSTPFLLFRKLNQFWAKHICSNGENILKILDPLAQIGAHDFFKPNPRLNIVACFIGEGEMSIKTLQELIRHNLIDSNIKVGSDQSHCQDQDVQSLISKSEYSELTCKVVEIGGFFYWQKMSHFDIADYVRTYTQDDDKLVLNKNSKKQITTESDLKKIIAHLNSKPWDHENRSPWEFLLINNYLDNEAINLEGQEPKWVVILRIHHHMADGYSILNITQRLSTGNFKVSAEPNSSFKRNKVSEGSGPGEQLLALISFPYQLALMLNELTGPKIQSWRLSPEQCKSAGEKYFQNWSSPILIESVKKIKNKFGVSFQAVLNSVFGGAIRSLMGMMNQQRDEVDEISAFLPIPLPHHPGGLSIHVGYLLVRLPVGDVDPVRRLEMASQELSRLGNSTFPIISFIVYSFIGLFPTFITSRVKSAANVGNSVLFSPFPMHSGHQYFGSLKASYALFTLGTGWGDAGAAITTCSSQDQVRFGISMDQHLCPSEDILYKFNEFIQGEIQTLLEAPNPNNTKTYNLKLLTVNET